MTELEKSFLLVMLQSQLQIENAIMGRLKVRQEQYNAHNHSNDSLSDLISMTDAKLIEIRRQIRIIEESQKNKND